MGSRFVREAMMQKLHSLQVEFQEMEVEGWVGWNGMAWDSMSRLVQVGAGNMGQTCQNIEGSRADIACILDMQNLETKSV